MNRRQLPRQCRRIRESSFGCCHSKTKTSGMHPVCVRNCECGFEWRDDCAVHTCECASRCLPDLRSRSAFLCPTTVEPHRRPASQTQAQLQTRTPMHSIHFISKPPISIMLCLCISTVHKRGAAVYARLRVRFHIFRNARSKNECKYQSSN